MNKFNKAYFVHATVAANISLSRRRDSDGHLCGVSEEKEVCPRILALAKKVANVRPTWDMFIHQMAARTTAALYIFCGTEQIGQVGQEMYYDRQGVWSSRLILYSPRIAANALRKNHLSTADDKKAFSAILAHMVPTPADARAKKLADLMLSSARKHVQKSLHYETDTALSPHTVHTFLASRGLWEEFAAHAVTSGAVPTLVTDLPERLSKMDVSLVMDAAASNGSAKVVVPVGDEYFVYTTQSRWELGDSVQSFNKADVPEAYRRSIGMLKLANGCTVVPNVGIRLDTDLENGDAFFITGGLEE